MSIYEGLNACPDLERYSDEPVYHTKAVEQQTGVLSNTLRAWERRYHVVKPKRAGNAYRLYSERDVILLRWLKERTENGMSISEAINFFEHLSKAQKQNPPPSIDASSPLNSLNIFQVATTQPPMLPQNLEEDLRQRTDRPAIIKEQEQVLRPSSYEPYAPLPEEVIQVAQERLLNAFKNLDDTEAQMVLTPLLITYPLEQICADLVTPTLWKIGDLWASKEITVTVEHFASNFFRGLLTNLFHVAPRPVNTSLVMVSCAPGEPHEIPALMLALILRLHNVRVAYLGQSIENEGLLHAIQQLQPSLVCASLTIAAHLGNLVSLAQQIQRLPTPRPRFIFGGQAFLAYPHIIKDIPGIYLHGTMNDIVKQIQTFYTEQR